MRGGEIAKWDFRFILYSSFSVQRGVVKRILKL